MATWPTRGEAASGDAAPGNPRRCLRPAYLRHRARLSLGGLSCVPDGLRREAGEQGAGPPPPEPRATAEPAGPHEWDAAAAAAAAAAELAVDCAHAPPRPGHVTQAPPPPAARLEPWAPPGESGSTPALASGERFKKFPPVPMATLRRCAGLQSPAAKKSANGLLHNGVKTLTLRNASAPSWDRCRTRIFRYLPLEPSANTAYLKVHCNGCSCES